MGSLTSLRKHLPPKLGDQHWTLGERLDFIDRVLERSWEPQQVTAFEIMEALLQIEDLRSELDRRGLLDERCPNVSL